MLLLMAPVCNNTIRYHKLTEESRGEKQELIMKQVYFALQDFSSSANEHFHP